MLLMVRLGYDKGGYAQSIRWKTQVLQKPTPGLCTLGLAQDTQEREPTN